MDFYDDLENDQSLNFVLTDYDTSDMPINDNENRSFFLTNLSEFMHKDRISKELIRPFNFNLNQKVLWENMLDTNDTFSRKTFNMDEFLKEYNYDIPEEYLIYHENDSVIADGITYFKAYLSQKYTDFDFGVMNSFVERLQIFDSFNLLYKLFSMFETLLPIAIRNNAEDCLILFDGLTEVEKYKKVKTKTYVGLIWNATMTNYLSKCQEEIFETFENQSWDFVSKYTLKNI